MTWEQHVLTQFFFPETKQPGFYLKRKSQLVACSHHHQNELLNKRTLTALTVELLPQTVTLKDFCEQL